MDQDNLVVKDSLTTKPVYNNIINTQKIRLVMSICYKYWTLLEVTICDRKLS